MALQPLPPDFVSTRDALHLVAEEIVARRRVALEFFDSHHRALGS
jgi:hypothetical protein